ncbi:MAG: hypothetical protein NVSMB38_45720 [Ktedonobacteraceae bacterium]
MAWGVQDQTFLESGDSIVFLGEFDPWYSPERRQCHLPREAGRRLLTGVLDTYQRLDVWPLRELFIHLVDAGSGQ